METEVVLKASGNSNQLAKLRIVNTERDQASQSES